MGVSNIVIGSVSENTMKVGAYNAAIGDAVSVGLTDGGVEISKSEDTKEIFVDQHLGAIDNVTIKEAVSVKLNIAEASLANLALAFGYPTTAVTGAESFVMGDKTDLRDPKTIYINVKGPGPGTRLITIHKAKIKGDCANKYTKDNVVMVPIEIEALCDTTKNAGERMLSIVDTGLDTTPPTVALTTPVDGGTVTKATKDTVIWTITETNGIDASSCIYGDTFSIIDITTPASATLKAGTIAVDSIAKTVTFTPTDDWTGSASFQAIVTTGLKDAAGNRLAATKIEQFSATV